MMLITPAQAIEHLRADTTEDDPDLLAKIQEASAIVLAYLKGASAGYFGEDGELIPSAVPFQVHAAVKLMLGYLYRNRDSDEEGDYEQGYLPKPVTSLLYPLRDPALA